MEKKIASLALITLFSSHTFAATETNSNTKNLEEKSKSTNSKKFNISTGVLRTAVGMKNIIARYKIQDKATLGISASNLSMTNLGIKVTGNSIGAEYMYFIGGEALTDSSFLRTQIDYTSMKVDGTTATEFNGVNLEGNASGIHAFVSYGYNWQWDNISLNVYGGLQHFNLSAKAKASDEYSSASSSGDVVGTHIDLGTQLGVSF